MTVADINELNEKAKNRKDGVYCYKGYLWVAKDNKFIAFTTPFGECFQRFGSFNVRIGTAGKYKYEMKKKLSELLKQQS